MARIRSLKIGFFTNERLAEFSPWHRLLFEGLWLLADREGRLEDRPRRIKAELFPYDALDIDPMLTDLADARFIQRYAMNGASYLSIVRVQRHQRPRPEEHPSAIPEPPELPPLTPNESMNLAIPRGIVTPPRVGSGVRGTGSGVEGEGDMGNGEAADGAAGADGAPPTMRLRPEEFQTSWNSETQPPIPRCRDLTTKRRRHIRARMTERPLTEWAEVFRRIQASAFCRGETGGTWVASFDWVIGSPDVAVKVLEGQYDNRTRGPTRDTPFTPDELRKAEEWRRKVGRCPHQPACETSNACIGRVIRQWRQQRAGISQKAVRV